MTTTTTSTSETAARVSPTGCCPPFDPAPWQGREIEWHDKLFVKEHVTSVLHVPLNMVRRLKRATARIEAASATAAQPLMLSHERSSWGADLYIDVTKDVPGARMATLSGTYLTRVFDGPYRDAPHWAEEMRHHVVTQGRSLRRLYFAYTTCPRCAKAYRHNYVIAFAEVEPFELS